MACMSADGCTGGDGFAQQKRVSLDQSIRSYAALALVAVGGVIGGPLASADKSFFPLIANPQTYSANVP